jgi:hypothetical protein
VIKAPFDAYDQPSNINYNPGKNQPGIFKIHMAPPIFDFEN